MKKLMTAVLCSVCFAIVVLVHIMVWGLCEVFVARKNLRAMLARRKRHDFSWVGQFARDFWASRPPLQETWLALLFAGGSIMFAVGLYISDVGA